MGLIVFDDNFCRIRYKSRKMIKVFTKMVIGDEVYG